MRNTLLAVVVLLLISNGTHLGAQENNKPIPTVGAVGEIVKIEGAFDPDGPIASSPTGVVWFADFTKSNGHRIIRIGVDGKTKELVDLKAECSALGFDPTGEPHEDKTAEKGWLIACLPKEKRVVAVDMAGKIKELVRDRIGGREIVDLAGAAPDGKGGIWISDGGAGEISYIDKDKKSRIVIEKLPAPGDLTIAPNGKTLYVVLRKTPIVMAYALDDDKPGVRAIRKKDEKTQPGTVFCTLKNPQKGEFKGGTGIGLDRKGNLFICTAAGIQVFNPKGAHLGNITFTDPPRDTAFGGADRKTLHAAGDDAVVKTRVEPPFDWYPLLLLFIGIGCIFFFIIYLRMHAFLALILAALIIGMLSPRVIFTTDPDTTGRVLDILSVPTKTAEAFGNLMGRIGLAIAFATIIGKAMMDSGAADRIVRFFTGLFGEKMAPGALLASGFILSIPVFFDNVFLLLIPLARALYVRTGKNYLLYVTAIGAGGAVTHSLVPPTPGPIVMSEILHVDLGYTILIGTLVGVPVALVGFCYCVFINKRMPIEMRESGSVSLEQLSEQSQVDAKELPPLWLSFLPILLPVIFITSQTIFSTLVRGNESLNAAIALGSFSVRPLAILRFFGAPNIALLIAAIISMLMVVTKKSLSREQLGKFTSDALLDAGMILLITSAGGAFGAMLKHVGIGESLGALSDKVGIEDAGILMIVLAWGLAMLFKVAQGSGTVAMITSAEILWSILKARMDVLHPGEEVTGELLAGYLGYHPVYLIMAIGCGSKIASWMNDSGFWVVSKMGNLTEAETLKSWTVTLVVMGLFGLPFVLLLTRILPLA